jgi:hypothetical protein
MNGFLVSLCEMISPASGFVGDLAADFVRCDRRLELFRVGDREGFDRMLCEVNRLVRDSVIDWETRDV